MHLCKGDYNLKLSIIWARCLACHIYNTNKKPDDGDAPSIQGRNAI